MKLGVSQGVCRGSETSPMMGSTPYRVAARRTCPSSVASFRERATHAPADSRESVQNDTAVNCILVWDGAREPQSGFPDGEGGRAVVQEAAGVSGKVLGSLPEQGPAAHCERDLEAPSVVLVEVWRGSVAPFSVAITLPSLSHLETRTLFLQAPCLADTCPRVMRQSTEVSDAFLELSYVKVSSDPDVDSLVHL